MKKDDIEKLISSLEDFSKTPPDDLWKGIEEKLDNPKSKKGFLFWWAIAASFVVGLGLLATFYSNPDNNSIAVPVEHENGLVNQSRSIDSIEKEAVKSKIGTAKKVLDTRLSNSNASDETQKQDNNSTTTTTTTKPTIFNSNNQKVFHSKNEAIVANANQYNSFLVTKNESSVASKEIKKEEKEVFSKENSTREQNKIVPEKTVVEDKVKENPAATDLKENALAAIEKEQLKKDKIALVEDKWSMQVFAGINNSQNLKKQKSLGNTIESQKGYNYGVKANYKLNRRWAVSTGFKISELGQQVANVSYINSAKTLVNISKFSSAQPQEKGAITTNSNYLFIPNSREMNMIASTFYEKGNLSQKVQYLEMPMEISYVVLNKGKARINMNTGGFVGKAISNKVLLNDSSIGKNQEVNDVVFGTVLSSTLQYELFKKTKVFVEPGMNYYTQPVQNQNFNQFQLIFNFGLNVSF
ncbi:hypothetical protein [Flavobacterium undicola]|uniref:hypothetical protein n=1 Tax=Flavobacterium undicola TaxID=1932779 RepID=UPI0013784E0E|nr:hypothetical protein [Flavobacterium undicola]MBA0883205.1 hypothetical protein [Flavobacterium undicola]